jgi:nucleoside-diphosphate-sugar epimerase
VIASALDAQSLHDAVAAAQPDAIVHALTAIPARGPMWASDLNATNELRITGTRNLLSAAIHTGTRRCVAESMVFIYGFGDLGDGLLTEADAVRQTCPKPWLRPVLDALASEEDQVLNAIRYGRIEGICLRFGGFYGPGAVTDRMAQLLRRRMLPIPKSPTSRGVPWIHIEDAAAAVVVALTRANPGETYNITDDQARYCHDPQTGQMRYTRPIHGRSQWDSWN